MSNIIVATGEKTRGIITHVGEITQLLGNILINSWYLFKKPGLFVRQIYQLGILSLPIILLSGLFVGMVLCFQAFVNLINFGAEASVGTIVALALFRELSSVLTALLYRASQFFAHC